jgi:hypothetical protein
MTILKRFLNWYDEITWKKTTRQYCEKLKGAKMGLGESVPLRQDDPSSDLPKK